MTADELLEQMETTALSVESNEKCIIDPETREIEVPLTYQLLGVESDEKVERIEFQCPRIVGDSIELSELQIRINFRNANQETDQYIVEDVTTDGENITFSWLLSRKATAYKGTVSFIVCAVKISGDSITNEWNTTLAESEVLEGLEVDTPSPSEEQSDVIAQLLQIMKDTSDQAVEAVESAEATAKQAIEDYTDQMKATIPEDYTEMVKKVDMLERTKAPAIYQTVSGESLQIEDSADAPMAGLRVFGKSRQVKTTGAQLIPCPIDEELESYDGFVAAISKDNGIEVTLKTGFNPINSNSDIYFAGGYQANEESNYELQPQIPAGQYHLHIDDETFNRFLFYIVVWRNEASNVLSSGTTQDIDITIQENDKFRIFIRPKTGTTTGTYTINPMLNSGSTALPWEPYTGGKPSPSPDYPQEIEIPGSEGSVGVNVTGANLLNYDEWKKANIVHGTGVYSDNGVTLTADENGDCYTNHLYVNDNVLRIPVAYGETYTASWEHSGSIGNVYLFQNGTTTMPYKIASATAEKLSITINSKDVTFLTLRVGVHNANRTATYKNIMLNVGFEALTFKPYKEPQHLTISTPNGLPGIPVDSGGNYTDSDGQQWICDEVDFKRGKYVQRVKKAVIDSSFSILKDESASRFFINTNSVFGAGERERLIVISNIARTIIPISNGVENQIFQYGDGIYWYGTNSFQDVQSFKDWLDADGNEFYVIGRLATPVETDLSEEELTAYAALRTNFPTTVVTSDSDPITVGIEVEYVADTKTFVENKINELKQLLAGTQSLLVDLT